MSVPNCFAIFLVIIISVLLMKMFAIYHNHPTLFSLQSTAYVWTSARSKSITVLILISNRQPADNRFTCWLVVWHCPSSSPSSFIHQLVHLYTVFVQSCRSTFSYDYWLLLGRQAIFSFCPWYACSVFPQKTGHKQKCAQSIYFLHIFRWPEHQ